MLTFFQAKEYGFVDLDGSVHDGHESRETKTWLDVALNK